MKIDMDKKQIRKFGFALAVLLVIMGIWQFYKGRTTPSTILFISGLTAGGAAMFFQPLIKPVYIVMMKIAHMLGWINTRILLGVIFYVIITPIGLFMKVFGKDIIDQKIETEKEDYWIRTEKKVFDKKSYENQY